MTDPGKSSGPSSSLDVARNQIDLLSLAEGFFGSRVLFSLSKLGVFKIMGEGECTLQGIAAKLNAREDTLARLLNAGVVLGLLESSDGARFKISAKWAPSLQSAKEESYLGNWIAFLDYIDTAFEGLSEAAVQGRPAMELLKVKNKTDLREFTLAMHNYAAVRGKELVHFLDTSACKTFLDLGCGPGTYSFHLGMHNPALEIFLIDLPEILEITKEVQQFYPLTNEIHYIPIDVTKVPIPNSYDMIFVSNTLHMLGEDNSRQLLKRLRDSVNDGGSLVIQAQFLNDDGLGGRWPIILDLAQLCITESGRNHTVAETTEWMQDAGYADIEYQPMSIFNTNGFIRGYKR